MSTESNLRQERRLGLVLLAVVAVGLVVGVAIFLGATSVDHAERETRNWKRDEARGLHVRRFDSHFEKSTLMRDRVGRSPRECGAGDYYNSTLTLCLPKVHEDSSFENDLLDTSTKQCDDFYRYSCGKWIDTHENMSRSFTSIAKVNRASVNKVIATAETNSAVYRFLQSCISTLVERNNRRQTKREAQYHLNRIVSRVDSYADIGNALAELIKSGFYAPFSLEIENNPTAASMIPLFEKNVLPLNQTEHFAPVYSLFIELFNPSEAVHKTRRLFRVVQDLGLTTRDEFINDWLLYLQSPLGMKNDLMSFKEFTEIIKDGNDRVQFSMYDMLETLGGRNMVFDDHQTVWVMEQEWFRNFEVKSISLEDWKLFLEFCVISSVIDYYPDLPMDVYYRNHARTIHKQGFSFVPRMWGVPKHKLNAQRTGPQASYEDCAQITHHMLAGEVGHMFHEYLGYQDKDYARVKQMVLNITKQFRKTIEKTEWIDEITKERALFKIDKINVRVGYPDHWPREPFLDRIHKDRYVRNINIVREYRVRRMLDLWRNEGKWFELDEIARFGSPISTVNAYYSPMTNSIVIFDGIMQYPFFRPGFNLRSLYSTLGVVVGHELSHSMDPFGSQFDQYGSFRNWWLLESKHNLQEQFRCLAAEYKAPEYCGEVKGYGNKTLGEDTADLLGVRLAFAAWKDAHAQGPHARDEQFTEDETAKWFYTYAQSWCAHYSQEKACKRVTTDEHPLPSMRVTQTLRNIPEFARLMGCIPTDKMVHDPPCKIY